MCIKKIIVYLVLIFSLLGFPTKDEAKELEIVRPSELTLEGQVSHYSKLYGADEDIVKGVIQNESKWNVNAVGDGGRSRGIAQFQEESFNRLSGLMGEDLDYHSPHDQIKLLSWSIANGHGREWTAYICIMNGGSYSFYSRQLQKHFTVYCK